MTIIMMIGLVIGGVPRRSKITPRREEMTQAVQPPAEVVGISGKTSVVLASLYRDCR